MVISDEIKKKILDFNIKKSFIFDIMTQWWGKQIIDLNETDPQFYKLVEKLHKFLRESMSWINEDTLDILSNNVINTINNFHNQIISIKNLWNYNEQQFNQQKPSLISSFTQWINQIFNEQDSFKFLNTYYRLKSDFIGNKKNFDQILERLNEISLRAKTTEKEIEQSNEVLDDKKTDIGLSDYSSYIDNLSKQYQSYRKWSMAGFSVSLFLALLLLFIFWSESYIHRIKVFWFIINRIWTEGIKTFTSVPYIFIVSSFLIRMSIVWVFVYLSKVFFESYRIFSNKIMMYEWKIQVIKSRKKLLQNWDTEESNKTNKLITEKVIDILYKDSNWTNYDLWWNTIPASYTEKLFDKILSAIPGKE